MEWKEIATPEYSHFFLNSEILLAGAAQSHKLNITVVVTITLKTFAGHHTPISFSQVIPNFNESKCLT